MTRIGKRTGPTPVESIQHGDKRVNLPTADAAVAYGYEPDVAQVRYPRDPTLDPQLVCAARTSRTAPTWSPTRQ